MNFPTLPETLRIERLQPPDRPVRMVLDTDTYNEIDDQFAVVYSLLAPERLTVEAFYAAPFFNPRSTGPRDGMEKSYDEIVRVLDRLGVSADGRVFRGSTGYLVDAKTPQESEAAHDLVARALASAPDDPLYVVGLGAITNVASALLIQPEIIERIIVVWMGGNAHHWAHNHEFNLEQDVAAAQVLFNCGVPLVQIPAWGVSSHLLTTLSEINTFVKGRGPIGDYLYTIYEEVSDDHFALSRIIWDTAAVAYLINADWIPSTLVHSPIVTDQLTYSFDTRRHLIRSAYYVERDPIFRDLFRRIAADHGKSTT